MFGQQLIMKLFRRIEPGLNPDVEIGRFLDRMRGARVPALVGDVPYERTGQTRRRWSMLQRYVWNQGNGWR